MLMCMLRRDTAYPARQHNGLVITAHLAVNSLFKGTKITGQIGTAKLIIERCTAKWSFQHDLQGGSNA